MAACYGCAKRDVTYAGEYCAECKPGASFQARRPGLPERYMPTPENERAAIVAYIHAVAGQEDFHDEDDIEFDIEEVLNTIADRIKAGRHTK